MLMHTLRPGAVEVGMTRCLDFFIAVLLFGASAAFGQGFRVGDAMNVTSVLTTPGIVSSVSNATINICHSPANAIPCTNRVITYTDHTLSVPCSAATQVVLAGTNSCVATTDSRGNWGAWVPPGNYDFTITVSTGQSFGPYTVSEKSPTRRNPPPGNLLTTAQDAHSGNSLIGIPCSIDQLVYVITGGCYTTIQAAITSLNGAAGTIIVPPGTWASASTITMTASGQHLLCSGISSTVISYTGSAAIMAVVDVGTAPDVSSQLDNISVNGCTISGNANVTYGIRVRGVHHSDFSHNSLINVTTAGIYTNYAVLDQFNDEHTSFNEQPFVVRPQSCLYFDGSTNLETTAAQVDHPICEGVSGTGIVLNLCSTCKISTGTSEQNNKGITISGGSNENEIEDVDTESNTTSDIEVSGSQNTVIGGVSLSLTRVLSGSPRTRIIGGLYNNLIIDSNAQNTSLFGVSYNNSGSGSITDNGTSTTKIDVTNIYTGVKDTNYTGSTNFLTIGTMTNCAQNTDSPSSCGSAPVGVFAVPPNQNTYTVNTTAVTSNSRIHIQQITDNTDIPSSPTCSATLANPLLSGRTAGTSFTFALTLVAATTCFEYWMEN
jgi:hypothetical protein